VLNLLRATIGVLRKRRLRAFFSEVLSGLAKRLGQASHRLDDIVLAHVQPRSDLLGSLIHHWGPLSAR